MLGAFPCDHLEVLMEAGEVVEPTFETQLFDADAIVYKQFACMPHTYLREELRIGLTCTGFEIAAEGIGYQAHDGRHLFEIYFLGEMTQRIVVNGVDALAFLFGEIMTETYG